MKDILMIIWIVNIVIIIVFFLKKPSDLKGLFRIFKVLKVSYVFIPISYLFEHFSHIVMFLIHTGLTLLLGGLLFGGFRIDINVDPFQIAQAITNVIGQMSMNQ